VYKEKAVSHVYQEKAVSHAYQDCKVRYLYEAYQKENYGILTVI
jgi:hypothetical protein